MKAAIEALFTAITTEGGDVKAAFAGLIDAILDVIAGIIKADA